METLKNNVLINNITNLFKHKDDITIPKDVRDLIKVFKYFKDPINEKDKDFQIIANYIQSRPKEDDFAAHLLSFYEKYQIKYVNHSYLINGRYNVITSVNIVAGFQKNEDKTMQKFEPLRMVMTEPGDEICIVKGRDGLFELGECNNNRDIRILPGHFMAYDLRIISHKNKNYNYEYDDDDIINSDKRINELIDYIEVKLNENISLRFNSNEELKKCFTIINPLIVIMDKWWSGHSYPKLNIHFKENINWNYYVEYKTIGLYKDIINEVIPEDKKINVVYNNEKYEYVNKKYEYVNKK